MGLKFEIARLPNVPWDSVRRLNLTGEITMNQAIRFNTQSGQPSERRRGAILLLSAFCLVAMFAFLAFTVDVGYITLAKCELQNAADAAALAAAMELKANLDPDIVITEAQNAAVAVAAANRGAGRDSVAVDPANGDIEFGRRVWDNETQSFEEFWGLDTAPYNLVRVNVRRTGDDNVPLFFAPIIKHDSTDMNVSAVATFQPRDIILVLDYSGSMNDDSELKTVGNLPQEDIEDNLEEMWEELGRPTYGSMGFTPQRKTGRTNSIIRELGLNRVSYPYPSGSWNDYVNYVQSSSDLRASGYQNKYGMMTLINYWLSQKAEATQTPVLWQVSAQPITALKGAVDIFIDYIQSVEAADKVGLSAYTYSDGTALLESELTFDLELIKAISRQRQAGHYDAYTNIGAGMKTAREELTANARPGAYLMMVLMTDGVANRPYNTYYAENYALQEAELAAASGIKIMTVSLGTGADTGLMQQIANISGGEHFNVPGGGRVADYAEQLRDAFREIAADRPVMLIQ